MTGRPRATRADLPDNFTPDTLRTVPMSILRQVANPRNGILTAEEQADFDRALTELMSEAAQRVSTQMNRSDWRTMMREAKGQGGRRGGPGMSPRASESLDRLTRRIEEQVGAAERLDPSVDWSFAQPDAGAGPHSADVEDSADAHQTVSELEAQLSDQVELVQVMSEIADLSRRTYAMEHQRDLASTRGFFFGFVVSVAVLVAGWAPLVIATWSQRWWTLGLTAVTCLIAGLIYTVVRRWQTDHDEAASRDSDGAA